LGGNIAAMPMRSANFAPACRPIQIFPADSLVKKPNSQQFCQLRESNGGVAAHSAVAGNPQWCALRLMVWFAFVGMFPAF
jgi:hypothetical protein